MYGSCLGPNLHPEYPVVNTYFVTMPRQQNSVHRDLHLLEDLAVGPLVGLAVDDKGLVPGPLVVDELAVLGLLGVELGEGVALVVGGDIESGESVLAANNESTLDDGVVALAVDGSTAEDVLAGSLETGEETAYLGQHVAISWIVRGTHQSGWRS